MKPRIKFHASINLYSCYEVDLLVKMPGFGKTPKEAYIDYFSRPKLGGNSHYGLFVIPDS